MKQFIYYLGAGIRESFLIQNWFHPTTLISDHYESAVFVCNDLFFLVNHKHVSNFLIPKPLTLMSQFSSLNLKPHTS